MITLAEYEELGIQIAAFVQRASQARPMGVEGDSAFHRDVGRHVLRIISAYLANETGDGRAWEQVKHDSGLG